MRLASTMALLAILSAVVLSPVETSATTWHVEKDGSGDYTVIQDAIDAAAVSDTIRIGPGRYEDYRTYTYPGGDYDIVANNTVGSLTVIGAGMDVTFIGVESEYPVYLSVGFFNVLTSQEGLFSISALTVEGSFFGFISESACDFSIADCCFRYCSNGIISFVSGAISDCRLMEISDKGIGAFASSHDLTIENCEFERCQYGFYFQASPNMNVVSCIFIDCLVGGYFDISSGSISDCSIDISPLGTGLGFKGNGQVLISGCTISNAYRNLYIVGASNLTFEDNIFNPTEAESIYICNCTPVFHNNHILHGSGYSVLLGCSFPSPNSIDLTNNYWGTTEPDSIAAWILDSNDAGGPRFGIVDFEPFSDVPLPADQPSLGGFKSMFR